MNRGQVISLLKQHEPELRAAGLGTLYLFGSVARDQAREGSDVDVFFDPNRLHGFTLFDLVAVQERDAGHSRPPCRRHDAEWASSPPPVADRSFRRSRVLMPDGRAIDSLLDILELIERISRQVAPMMREQFLDDPDVQDATAYRLLAIGEASKDLSDEMKACYPDVPWRQVVGLRNVLADQYFVRESDLIWETVTVGLPRLAEVCRRELRRLGWTADPPAAPVP